MPESIGTMSLRLTADATGLVSTVRSTAREVDSSAVSFRKAGADIRGSFNESQGAAQRFFANLQSGNIGDLTSGLTSHFAGMASSAVAAMGPIGTAAAGAAGAVLGIGLAARSASKEVDDMRKLAARIGSSVPEAGTILRAFDRAGIEDAEGTLNKFFNRLGDVRSNIEGPTANAFRQLRLDPSQLVAGSPLDAIRSTVEALGNVSNVYERANLSQQIFGKSFQEVQELIRQGGSAFDRAARQESQFGPGEGTIAAAQHAEQEWREVSRESGAVWEGVKTFGRAAGSRISDIFGTVANGLFQGRDRLVESLANLGGIDTSDIPTIGVGGQRPERPPQLSAGAVQAEQEIRQFRERNELQDRAADTARQLGLVGADATRQEAEAMKDLIEWRQRSIEAARKQGATDQEVANITTTATAAVTEEARRRQNRASQGIRDSITEMERMVGFQGGALRARAVQAGFVGQGASLNDAAQVRDLVETLEKFRRSRPNVTADEVANERERLRAIARERSRTALEGSIEEDQRALTMRSTVEAEDLSARAAARFTAALREQQEVERGIAPDLAARRRSISEENDFLERRRAIVQSLRTPMREFVDQQAEIAELTNRSQLTPEQGTLAQLANFRRLEQSLGQVPTAMTGIDPRSLEGARAMAELQMRQQIRSEDPQERVRRVMESSREIQQQTLDEARRMVRAIEQGGIGIARG